MGLEEVFLVEKLYSVVINVRIKISTRLSSWMAS